MKFGISDSHFQLLSKLVVEPLKDKGARVYIFGSRVTGRHHPHSDVDILYSVDQRLPTGFLAEVKERIEESRFPYTIDLVAERDLADSYRENVFRQRQEV